MTFPCPTACNHACKLSWSLLALSYALPIEISAWKEPSRPIRDTLALSYSIKPYLDIVRSHHLSFDWGMAARLSAQLSAHLAREFLLRVGFGIRPPSASVDVPSSRLFRRGTSRFSRSNALSLALDDHYETAQRLISHDITTDGRDESAFLASRPARPTRCRGT